MHVENVYAIRSALLYFCREAKGKPHIPNDLNSTDQLGASEELDVFNHCEPQELRFHR